VIVSVDAAEAAKNAVRRERPSLVRYLKSFPDDVDLGDEAFTRNPSPSRDLDL
jgi:hypothetical protein